MQQKPLARIVMLSILACHGCAAVEDGWFYDAAVDPADTRDHDPHTHGDPDAAVDTAVDDGPAPDTAAADVAVDDGVDLVEEEIDGADPACDIDLGAFSPGDTASFLDAAYGDYWDVLGSIGSSLYSDPCSMVVVQSNVGMGGPVSPGTYSITSFVSPMSCTACIFAMQDCDMETGACAHMYSAASATLEITALESRDGGRIDGTLRDAIMIEVDPTTGSPIPGGGTVCLDEWRFGGTFVGI